MKPYFLWISCAVSDAVGACRSGSPRRETGVFSGLCKPSLKD